MRNKIILILLVAVLVVLVLSVPFKFVLNFSHDDSFFYLKTAQNLSSGYGSTFDGFSPTNGYHPLYFLIIAAVFFTIKIFSITSPETSFRFVFLFHVLLISFSVYFLYRFSLRYFTQQFFRLKFAMLIAGLFALVFIKDYGVESHITLLILSIYLFLSPGGEFLHTRKIIYKSVLLSLLFLTRTDYLFSLIPMLVIYEFLTDKNRKNLLSAILLVAVTAIAYYAVNLLVWGNIFTISTVICNSFPEFLFKDNLTGIIEDKAKLLNQFIRIVFLVTAPVMFLLFRKRDGRFLKISNTDFLLIMMIAGFLIFSFLHLSFNYRSLREWYMTVTVLPCIFLLIRIIEHRSSLIIKTAFTAVIAASVFTFSYIRMTNFKFDAAYEYAKEIERIVPEGQKVFQMDFTGVIGYFSDRSVVNGDGLINSFSYLGELRKGRVLDGMRNYGIGYYSTYTIKNAPFENGIFTEDSFGTIFNNNYLKLSRNDAVIEKPYLYDHAMFTTRGYWLLFKFEK